MQNILDLLQGNTDNIQELIFEDCLLKEGLHLEIYCNPDGIYYNDEEEEINRYKKHSKIYKNLYTKHYINVTIF